MTENAARLETRLFVFALAAYGCSSATHSQPTGGAGAGGASPVTEAGGAAGLSAATGASGAGAGGSPAALGSAGLPATATGGTSGLVRDGGATRLAPEGGEDSGPGPAVGDWGPGDYPPDLAAQTYLELTGVKGQGSYTRQFKVHVPPSYDPRVPTPVVFCIHGLGQNAVMFCVTGASMDQKSNDAGFILIMPNGYQSSWNAGTCCGAASTEKLDDVALFRAIFAEAKQHLNIDPRRVYATGLSNGAYMSYRLACDAADIFAAVAPGAGAVGINAIGGGTNSASDFTACNPTEHVSVLDIHGTSDPLIPYSLQAPTLALVTEKDGCSGSPSPAKSPKSAGDTACVTYSGCPPKIEVTACSITGGGHCWFGSSDCGTGGGAIGAAFVGANSNTMLNTDAVWDFFSRTSK